MTSDRPDRLSYVESCRLLIRLECLSLHDCGGKLPTLPDQRPQPGDDLPFGVRFFRTWVGSGRPFGLQVPPDFESGLKESDLENLTLPRTFFGRSEISRISFRNTDLSESTLCWNDFIQVNFTDADLSACDLRAALFTGVVFVRANLQNADLRRSSFKECDFTDADLRGAKMAHSKGDTLPLSEDQRRAVDWQESEEEEPPGG